MAETAIANRPEVRDMMGTVQSIQAYAAGVVITTPEQFEDAAEHLKGVMAAKKRLEEMRTKITAPLNQSLKEANNLFRTPGDTLAQAERTIKSRLASYTEAQEAAQREEQRKADAAAQAERDRLAELARKAAESGRTAAAEKHTARADAVVAPVINRAPPAVSGVAMREVWKFQVEKPELVPREYLAVDEQKIGAYVRAMKADAKIPGVRIYPEKQVAAGSR